MPLGEIQPNGDLTAGFGCRSSNRSFLTNATFFWLTVVKYLEDKGASVVAIQIPELMVLASDYILNL